MVSVRYKITIFTMLIILDGIKLSSQSVFHAVDVATVLKTPLDRISGTKVDLDLARFLRRNHEETAETGEAAWARRPRHAFQNRV